MLRRYRSLKKIVYAACILFATILLYAGTSSRDYHQDTSREWVLPVVARNSYHLDVSFHEPLHRLPLGPFEDHPVPIMVEDLEMQIPTFEGDKLEDVGPPSNVAPSNPNDLAPKPTAPAALKPPQSPGVGAETSNSAANSSAPKKHPVPGIATANTNNIVPGIGADADSHQAPAVPSAAAIGHGMPATVAVHQVPVDSRDSANAAAHEAANPSSAVGNVSVPIPSKPQFPLANPVIPHNPPPPPVQNQPTKRLPDLNKVMTEMARRLNHTRSQCNKFKVPYTIDSEVYQLHQHNMSYCKIPKAGCTYWEQVIAFLNKPSHELSYLGVKMPFQISKFDIRYTSHFNLPRRDFKKEADMVGIMKSMRVLFVRHPLERLWSCYLEKFYLIDFWATAGVAMKTSGADRKCPKSITFREFIDFTLPLFNENWAPMTELCNPCLFQPHVIGHVETLRDDSFYTLKKVPRVFSF
ncbi:hypothetical protein BsWGS_24717 [Bradybaena similaris]